METKRKRKKKRKKHKTQDDKKKKKKSKTKSTLTDEDAQWRERLFGEMDEEPFAGWTDESDGDDWYEEVAKRFYRKQEIEDRAERLRRRHGSLPSAQAPEPPLPEEQHKTQTHYDRLGVSRNATSAQIRAAYLRLAKELHPDKRQIEENDLMAELNNARDILTDPSTRQTYDLSLV